MGTDVIIVLDTGAENENILNKAQEVIIDFEKRFSRFLPENELFRFNNYTEGMFQSSEIFLDILKEVKFYFLKTNGLFDPTIIENLESIGYKNSFENVRNDLEEIDFGDLNVKFNIRSRISDLKIIDSAIFHPANLKVDLGGIGKGYINDLLSRTVFAELDNYWISAGGDVLAIGNDENNLGWNIGVQDPFNPGDDIFIINTKGEKIGIATSGIIKRNGITGDFKWHHIIDPRTGLPVVNEVVSVTVISSSATKADVLAKTLLILGESEALRVIEKEEDSAAILFVKGKAPIISRRAYSFIHKY